MAACRVGVLTYPEVSHKGENLTSGSLATPEHPRSGINKPGLSGDTPSRTAKAGASLIAAEVVKYAVFNLALVIITPLVALIPIRLQEAAGGPTPPMQSLIGLPDLLVSCAILAWGALRDAMDADHVTKPIQQIFICLGLVLATFAIMPRVLPRPGG